MRNFYPLLAAVVTLAFIGIHPAFAQTISFNGSTLQGETISTPTSLQFGPDDRLYVSQQNGTIKVYTVERDDAAPGDGVYSVLSVEEIDLIKDNVRNHNDDGTVNATMKRQVTGLLVAGTAQTPIIYVTSSDWRIGGGGSGSDLNLDTNSGILSKLTKTANGWEKVDLVRGLPRCEENHSTNGMSLSGNTLLVQSGGHTNKGAPSNNFSGTPEYMLSGVLLRMDLGALNSMPVYTDPRTGTDYVYDLPTLNDPTRADIDNTSPDFPYPSGHPMYGATIDVGDPFGGNNSLNQAIPEPGGPVQVFSHGYRNAYDVVITDAGNIFTFDNGPNGGWGGQPLIYNSDGTLKGVQGESGVTFNPGAGDYISNEFNESSSSGHGDPLHYVGNISDADNTYYAGHPAPIQAFPSKAQVIVYEENNSGNWEEIERHDLADLLVGTRGYFDAALTIGDFPDLPEQGEYLTGSVGIPGVNIIDIQGSSTNGMVEYTAVNNFDGAMAGQLLATSFDDNVYRYKIGADLTSFEEKDDIFTGLNKPLDVTAQGDTDIFPGTVWVADYGGGTIYVYEPVDFGDCPGPDDMSYVATADYDGDGYSNEDEITVGTNHCSAGSIPADFDGDFSPDALDDDDDDDGILDKNDAFAHDPDNGTTFDLPIDYPFWNNNPGTGFFGLGFTGLMTNGSTDYLQQYDIDNLSPGGAAGKLGIDAVTEGDALTNNQDNGFQFGINVDANSPAFTVRSAIESPYFLVNGQETTPVDNQSQGIYIGTGDQDNYLRVVYQNGITSGDNVYGIEVLLEDNGTVTSNTFDVPGIENASAVEIYISVDPAAGTAQPAISLNGGFDVTTLGDPITLPSSFLDPNDGKGLAVGVIATSAGPGDEFGASWDYITVTENQPGVLVADPTSVDFGAVTESSSATEVDVELTNLGGPADGDISISAIDFTGTDAGLFSTTTTAPIVITAGNEVLLPVILTPGADLGPKSAALEITHDGTNSPLVVPLTVQIIENDVFLVRINAGDVFAPATDDGPDWEENTTLTGTSYTVISDANNTSTHNIPLSGRHSSIPDYIDDATFLALFKKERWDPFPAPEMQFQIPLPNEEYKVNLYMANGFAGTSQPGERVFDILLEGVLVENDLDLAGTYGHQVGVMLQYPVTVTDGVLNIEFMREEENPLINAIEIIGPDITFDPIAVDPITDQMNMVADDVDLAVAATGGDPQANFTYSIAGQPTGIDIEPTNGHIFGTIATEALTGGPNSDGVHSVNVTVTKPGSEAVTESFTWTVTNVSQSWMDQTDDENYTARHECSFVQAGDKFYLFGGRESATTLDVYDFASKTWSPIPNSAPKQFNHFQATEYQGLIWVIGAFQDNGFPNETPADYIWAYDPANDEWIQGPEIPNDRKRGSAGLVVHNDKFYIVGGNTDGHDGGYVNWFDEYDPATGQWTTLDDAPRARDHFHIAVIGTKLYAAGGRLSGGDGGVFQPLIAEVDVYDFGTGTWSTLPEAQDLPTPRAAAATTAFQGELYLIGGEIGTDLDGNEIDDAVKTTESFDPSSGVWTTHGDLITERHGTQAIVSGDGIHVAAGSSTKAGAGTMKNMEYFGADNPQGSPSVAGTFGAPTSVQIPIGGSATIELTNSGGNVAILLGAMTLGGPDEAEFNLGAGADPVGIIPTEGSHQVTVSFAGTEVGRTATLTIEYGAGNTAVINLESIGVATVLHRINAGGALQTDPDGDWTEDQADPVTGQSGGSASDGTPSPYVNSDVSDQTFGANPANFVNTTGYPDALFTTERYSDVANPDNMQWDFPVANGDYEVKLLFAERWTGASETGVRVFDVQIEGITELSGFDQTAAYGWNTAGVETFQVTVTDGNLDIDFIKNLQNPNIKAIEIADLGTNPVTNDPPVVTNPGDQFNLEGDVVSLPIAATAPENDQTLTYSATGLPPTLTMDPSTGLISGTIDAGSGTGTQAFQESNGLVIAEAESRPSVGGWEILEEAGVTYQHATSNHFGNTNGGTIEYEIQITTPGVYRFQMKSDITGTNTTEENDSWFKLPQTDDIHWVCVVGGISNEQQLIDNINGTASDKTFYYPNGSGRTPVHVGENPGVNGFFKVYRSGGGGNKWDAKTIDNNGYPIYAYFVNPGTYTLQMSERSGGHKVDRFALYKVDTHGTGIPTATLDGAESTQSDPGMAGAAANSPYDVEVVVVDDGDPVESTTIDFQWFVSAEPNVPGALVQVNPGGGLNASTFNNNSFLINNTGESDIVNVTIDLRTSVLPESVFDPLGLAGDATAKCLTAGTNATPGEVGLFVDGDGGSSAADEDCSTVFAAPHNGVDGNEGFDVLTLDFTDFNAGEIFSFGVDIDPLSIKNDNTAGDAGSVSGFELAGATVTITFANGQTLTTTLWDEGSLGGSQAVVEEVIPDPAPSIEMVGLTLPVLTNEANQTVRITGTPNAAVTLLQVDARLYIDAGGGGYDIDPFEANTVMTKVLYTATLDGSGLADIPVTLLQTTSPDAGPDGGLNHFLAVENGTGDITSIASNVLVVEYDPDLTPGSDLTLNVTLQGRDSDHSGSCNVDFYLSSDLSAPAYTFSLTADAAGDMVLPQPVASGDYQVVVNRPGYLQHIVALTVAGDAYESLGMLLAGDINGDDIVDIGDFSILASAFLAVSTDPGFEPLADYNGDGLIDISDFSILAQNFLLQGDELATN